MYSAQTLGHQKYGFDGLGITPGELKTPDEKNRVRRMSLPLHAGIEWGSPYGKVEIITNSNALSFSQAATFDDKVQDLVGYRYNT